MRTNAEYEGDLPKSKVRSKHRGDLNIAMSLQQKLALFFAIRSLCNTISYENSFGWNVCMSFCPFFASSWYFSINCFKGSSVFLFYCLLNLLAWDITGVFYFRTTPKFFCYFKSRSFWYFSCIKVFSFFFLILGWILGFSAGGKFSSFSLNMQSTKEYWPACFVMCCYRDIATTSGG